MSGAHIDGHATDGTPQLIVTDQVGQLCWLRLNRPQRRNALNSGLIAALDAAVSAALDDPQTAVIVIAGRGPSFCAGADLHFLLQLAQRDEDPTALLTVISELFIRMEEAPKPIIAAVHGHAVAGGLELALACDIVVAEAGALLGDGHARNGLIPGGGSSVRLPRKVGEPMARWLMLSGQLLPPEAFLASGFVHAVAETGDLPATVERVAEQLIATSMPGVHGRVKRLLADQAGPTTQAHVRERNMLLEHWHAEDIASRLDRFVGKAV